MIYDVSPRATKLEMGLAAGLYMKVGKINSSLAVLIVQPSLSQKLEAYQLAPVTVIPQLLAFLHGFKNAKMRKTYKIVIIR